MKLAYSYIRFSSGEQKKSDSFRRQWEACVKFCEDNQLLLEKSRRFYDEAVSGFRGKNRTEGALSKLLKKIKSGAVPVGSVIIIEAFDRLSREDVFTAYTTFTDILKSGMEIVTLIDKQWYSRDALNKNMGQLFISLGAIWSRAAMTRSRICADVSPGCAPDISRNFTCGTSMCISIRSSNGPEILPR